MERRIAAVLAADMVGYSRLVERDEIGTLERQKRHLHELIEPTITSKNGRIVKLTGDGLIAEFTSVVEAVQCAVSIQAEMAAREADFPEDEKIIYRVAIHLGDVVFDDGDVYGDGVNVAARLEALAEPGGVVVSGTAYDVLKANVDVAYKALGEQQLKNIATPVRVYQVVEGVHRVSTKHAPRRGVWAIAAVAVIAMLGGLVWWAQRPDFTPVDPAEMALTLPEDPSIAVLPFELRGDAGENDWAADGITDSIIATLSLAPELVVIGRSTMISYRGREVGAAEIARELGVRYVMSGSVAVSGEKLNVRAELADALEGNVIWAVQKDSNVNDLMAAQDEIAELVFEETSVALTEGQGAARSWIKAAGGFDTYVEVIRGRVEFQKFSPVGHANAEDIWGALYEEKPDAAFTNYLMGYLHWQKLILGISEDPPVDLSEAERFATQALNIEEFGEGYTLLAYLEIIKGNCDAANIHADRSQALAPSISETHLLGGGTKIICGRVEEGLRDMERGMRMEPNYPDFVPETVVYARLELGRYDEARELAEAVMSSDDIVDPRAKPRTAAHLAVLSVFEGDMTEAQQWGRELMELNPKATAAAERASRQNYVNQDFVEKYVTALLAAGVPETAPADPENFAYPLPEEPSIAVLPFANLTGSSENDYLGEGIAGNVISSLGAVPRVFVIARQSSFAYRSAEHSAGEIAEALGVRYLLDGSIQRSNDKMRTSVELIDTLDGRQVWSKQFENDLSVDDLFVVQDQIVADVLAELDTTLVSGDYGRVIFNEAGDLATYKQIMLGLAEVDKITIEGDQKAVEHFEAVLARNPNSLYAHFGLSWANLNSILMGYSPDPRRSLEIARSHAEQALIANSQAAIAHTAMAWVNLFLQEHDLAIASADRAVALLPSDGRVASLAGWVLYASGLPERGEALLRFGSRSQPSPPVWVPNVLAITLMMQGEREEAKKLFIKANEIFPNPLSHSHLAAIAALDGEVSDANRHVERAKEIYPRVSIAGNARYFAYIRDKAYLERFLDALREASYPEDPP